MSKGKFRDARFCPFCGVQSLERDRSGETKEKPAFKNEFHCTTCGMAIAILPSTRYMQAASLAKGHHQMRPPDLPPKVKPADLELYTLQKYAEKIGARAIIKRSKTKIAKFLFLHPTNGRCVGSLDFDGAMKFLRGYEIAAKYHESGENLN
jgi:hypothetical protein